MRPRGAGRDPERLLVGGEHACFCGTATGLHSHLMSKFLAHDTADPHISIPVGITVGLLASFVQSLGLTIQRKSHVQNQSLPEDEQKVEHRRP